VNTKSSPYTTFVDISAAVHASFCVKFYTTVKQENVGLRYENKIGCKLALFTSRKSHTGF